MSRERAKRATLPPAQENIEKLEKVVKQGNYYGAQQMFKSISARYVSAERCFEALDILHCGACLQLENGQVTCGSELALLFVETLVKGKVSYNEETLDHVRKIYEKFPRPSVPQNLDFADDDADNMQKLTEAIAAAKTRDMVKVSFHFVRGRNLKKFVSTIINFTGKCYPGEDDLAIGRAILMYLSLGNLRDANKLMDEVEKEMQSKHLDFPQSDLMQFVNYLLLTLQRDALPLFNMLRQKCKSSIDRDPLFNELLDEVGKKFYGVQRKNPLQGMFGDIFKIMGGE
ncbi:hypothetical protein RND71_032118 [Anisodus tanguticus]|uniref:Golgi to ER traffic protein 4 homolog n=1 Tax=Anisodus tanguticus TaxID=243964 RepID=A0AAE1RD36_9SOLA|nr:hypothetical protein RND71_032118 [Anisodus tanguticus]